MNKDLESSAQDMQSSKGVLQSLAWVNGAETSKGRAEEEPPVQEPGQGMSIERVVAAACLRIQQKLKDAKTAFRASNPLDGYMCKEDLRCLLVKCNLMQDNAVAHHPAGQELATVNGHAVIPATSLRAHVTATRAQWDHERKKMDVCPGPKSNFSEPEQTYAEVHCADQHSLHMLDLLWAHLDTAGKGKVDFATFAQCFFGPRVAVKTNNAKALPSGCGPLRRRQPAAPHKSGPPLYAERSAQRQRGRRGLGIRLPGAQLTQPALSATAAPPIPVGLL